MKKCIVFAAAITGVCALSYLLVQQNYRESLNDPQIQIVEDAANAESRLAGEGSFPAETIPHGTPLVDIKNSLAPWIAVYDSNGHVLEATGQLDNAPPTLPSGVFDTSGWHAHLDGSPVLQTRFTWQPEPDVRQAVILAQTQDKKYFVASGRNMREVEQRIEHEGEIVFVMWVLTLGAVLACILIGVWAFRRT